MSSLNVNPNKKHELYSNYLHEISGSQFTLREIDIISCVLRNRGEKKIADILDISPRTVGTHIRNIMGKFGASNSRDYIIDSIEKSGKLQYVDQYYLHLIIEELFKKYLKKIAKTFNLKGIEVFCDFNNATKYENDILQQLIGFLKLANINLNQCNNNRKSHQSVYIINNLLTATGQSSNNQKNIGLLLNNDVNSSLLEKIDYIDFRRSNNYYFAVFELIDKITNKTNFNELTIRFKDDYKKLESSYKKFYIDKTSIEKTSITEPNKITKKYFIFLILTGIILIYSIYIFTSPKKDIDISAINKRLAELVHLYSADNISIKQEIRQNYNLVKDVKKTIGYLDLQHVQEYFKSKDLQQDELINCLYVMHALATNYTYNEHNGTQASHILHIAKDIAESYVTNSSNITVEFNNLNAKEIYQELRLTDNLAQIYTKIVYLLGSSYLYLGEFDKARGYFEIASFLGKKLKLFEGYLSSRGGLNVIRRYNIYNLIDRGENEEAKKLLIESISALEKLRDDTGEYMINYRPDNIKPRIIIPSEDIHNKLFINQQIVKAYYQLIGIASDKKEKILYSKIIIEYFISNNSKFNILSNLDETVPKRSAGICSSLGMILLKFIDEEIEFNDFREKIISILNLTRDNDLSIIEQIFEISKNKSRNTDYTKADSYHGLMLVNKKKLSETNSEQDIKYYKSQILEMENKRNELNKKLNRDNWKLRLQDSLY